MLLLSGGEKHNGLLKGTGTTSWLPHRCDVDSIWNNNVNGENLDEGEGRFKRNMKIYFCKAHLLSYNAKKHVVLIFTVTADRKSVSVCMKSL